MKQAIVLDKSEVNPGKEKESGLSLAAIISRSYIRECFKSEFILTSNVRRFLKLSFFCTGTNILQFS
jgi:hypothetical protein